ncbi:MAG: hypothetical protein GY948_03730 [Alphaproteobacteria bacterium]|nr:hypothetical protein [Alphaproteobacteria bacterium]
MGLAIYRLMAALVVAGVSGSAALDPDVAKAMSTKVTAAIKTILAISVVSLDCGLGMRVATAFI